MPPANRATATRQTGLFGHPVAHSQSPEIHQRWLAAHGIDARYTAFDVTPEQLPQAVQRMRAMKFLGINLTVPHKERVLKYVDSVDIAAEKIGAANTLYWREETLCATNTDADGFLNNLRVHCPTLQHHLASVLVLGAGGAARAVVYALKQAGAGQITIANRTVAKAEALARAFTVDAVAWEALEGAMQHATLLVNTTSLGMEGQPPLDITLTQLPKSALVHDIVYAPLVTPLLQQASARGNPVVTGLGMLYYQAQSAFALWHGVTPEVVLP